MKSKKSTTDYWFIIEPYVFISITKKRVLLYNTLDGASLESDKEEVNQLLRETLQKENCGVVLLKNERYEQKDIHVFIKKLREKFMGDIIDVTLSKGKPIQLLPYFNYFDKHEIYKNLNSSLYKDVLDNLFEISVHVDNATNLKKLIPFLQSILRISRFNIIGNIGNVPNYNELLSFLDGYSSSKYILCSYKDVISLHPVFEISFSYRISVYFPIDIHQWNISRQILLNKKMQLKYVLYVSSKEDCVQAEQLVEKFRIDDFQIKPFFTGDNIRFFEENVFLNEEDILSTPISIKDLFARQSMNTYDFGKIHIMPNGNVYANLNHPVLGNISANSIHEIVHQEMDEGISWFRIRNQGPCSNCIYQWLCPSPSDYEIVIDSPNLCHVKQR
nr:TIGR04150 pseudo-rSAM protein [uncultured Macellibacteroides sp.]